MSLPGGRILVVDDHRTSRLKLSLGLKEQGHAVGEAADGRQALQMLRAEPFDLVLLDIVMPEMDGYEVLEQMRKDGALRDVPVIVISAMDDLDSVVKGIELGADDYLPKTFDPVLLRARLGACLEKKRLRDQERRLQEQIREANERMEQELALARDVQQSFLPRRLPGIPGWQAAVCLRPAREMSGDYYDLFLLPDGRVGILIADVSGKGAAAALFMALSRTLIRTYAAEYPSQPELTLAAAHRRILGDTQTEQFVTLFYGVLDPGLGTLVYANAGHCPPYLVAASAAEPIRELDGTGPALGLFPGAAWEQATARLAPGDALVLFTDGVTECRDQGGAFFGEERLVRLLDAQRSSAQPASAVELQQAVVAAVDGFRGAAPQPDDLAVVVLVRQR